jgi:hypothetical protein
VGSFLALGDQFRGFPFGFRSPDERATQVLTDNSAELARAFGLTG